MRRTKTAGGRSTAGAIRLLTFVLASMLYGCQPFDDSASPTARGQYVSESNCAGCHEAQHGAWTGSHHDLAMQDADEQTVLGDFEDASFSSGGITSRFFRRNGKFYVTTDGPDGKLTDYEIKHAFGVEPLQQYLIELPGGRLQALSIAWDTRRKRWFHLYPGQRIDYKDELHWTGLAQNWNHMCGECHATNYRKNFDTATGAFETTATRFDVGCQACHGPASRHAAWAQRAGEAAAHSSPGVRKQDFDVDLAARESSVQIETCARCHSRRTTLSPGFRHGERLMDTHLPALLDESLYFADGQILDEVYVYGSFLQSRMHAKGVRCSDCHDPHTAGIRASGNALCVTCHNASSSLAGSHIDGSGLKRKDYDSPAHHFHEAGKPGSQCVDCHAPARTYMVVDPRRDHSFRIPRPDLTVELGTPNACNRCHSKQSPDWAAGIVAEWYGSARRQEPHFGSVLDAGRSGKPGAVQGLVALAGDTARPGIVRATALQLLSAYPGRSSLMALQRGLRDTDPMVRRAAVTGQESLPPAQRTAPLLPLLKDPVLAVRIETARLLAPVAASLEAGDKKRLDIVLAEFEAVQRENADRPESHVNLGNLALAGGDNERAEAAYRKAITLNPRFVPAYANLADLYRSLARDADAEGTLREGLRAVPGSAPLHEALGLALVRQGKQGAALAEFSAAHKAQPDNPRHAYVYAVALDSDGRRADAIRILENIVKKHGDRDALLALAAFSLQAGNPDAAKSAINMLASINPDDPDLSRFLSGRP